MNEEEGEELKDIDLKENILLEVNHKEDKTVDTNMAKQNQKSIYEIKSEEREGIGFICNIPDPYKEDDFIKVLFSCYHVMKDVNKISIISSDKKEKIINIKEGRRYWLDEEMDYACIEILKEDNLSNYLSVFNDINDEKYQNKYIEKQLLYASNTNRISQGKGKMTPKYLLYNIVTYDGWSGSPIFLNEDNKVIGIHMAKNDMSKDKKDNQIIKNEKVVNIGIPIKNVLIHMKEMGEGNAK